MRYSVGDMLTFDLPDTVIDGLDAIIIRPPEIDPQTGMVKLTLIGETDAKHAYALGKTGTAPPTPSLLDIEEADVAVADNSTPDAISGLELSALSIAIFNSYITNLAAAFTGADEGTTASIIVPDHDRVYPSPYTSPVAIDGATIGGLVYATNYYIYYDDAALAGGAVTYGTTTNADDAYPTATNPSRHYVASRLTVSSGGGGGGGGGLPPWA
jgi:hypothetical protein